MSRPLPNSAIISDIETALQSAQGDKRTKVLMSITDLFVGEAMKYSDNQTKLFDDVLLHLIDRVESSALVEIAARLAPMPKAPANTIRQLARNDSVGISGPILSSSPQLRDSDLIEIAKTKSQLHLANIARRPRLNEAVTDVLVDHGDADVANEVAGNSGALFSKLTMAKLVMRADGDDRLTESISRRTDISPHMFRQLLSQATAAVRAKLLISARPDQRGTISKVMDEISSEVSRSPVTLQHYARAERAVAVFSQDTNLIKMKILEFADTKNVAELIAGLASVSSLTADQVDRLFYAATCFGLMILCKASALAWKTTYAVVCARPAGLEISSHDELSEQFKGLSISSAQTLISFWQGRQKVIHAIENRVR